MAEDWKAKNWDELVAGAILHQRQNFMACLICSRIEPIKANANRAFVSELDTGYVVLGGILQALDIWVL